MNIEQRLNQVAERYKAQGYQVVVHPGPDVLPPFAKDFKVEILAQRQDSNVLALAKMTTADLADDPNAPSYAAITGKQPGWRLDLFIMEGDSPPAINRRKVTEPSEDAIRRALNEVEQLLQAGFVAPSFTAAWAALEAVMRRFLHARGEKVGWGSSLQTMLNELYSDGVLSTTTFRHLEGLFQLWNEIVHGFAAPAVEPNNVQLIVETARTLLSETQLVKQTA